jgi:raffinose/stachyose/melibiose transport system permease protein
MPRRISSVGRISSARRGVPRPHLRADALLLPSPTYLLRFGTYLLSSVYGTFPREILEAAAIDGASRWQILWRVIFPISRPTLSVLVIFFFIWTWNEFLIPLTFLASNDNQTVPVAISVLQGDRLMDVTTISASALLGIIPTLIFFLIFQRTLTRGITAGAVK